MSNKEIMTYVEDWLKQRRIKAYFSDKSKGKDKYIKMKEIDLYKLCYKLVDLIKDNIE